MHGVDGAHGGNKDKEGLFRADLVDSFGQ